MLVKWKTERYTMFIFLRLFILLFITGDRNDNNQNFIKLNYVIEHSLSKADIKIK